MLNFFNSVLYETIIAENESEKQVLTMVRLLHKLIALNMQCSRRVFLNTQNPKVPIRSYYLQNTENPIFFILFMKASLNPLTLCASTTTIRFFLAREQPT